MLLQRKKIESEYFKNNAGLIIIIVKNNYLQVKLQVKLKLPPV